MQLSSERLAAQAAVLLAILGCCAFPGASAGDPGAARVRAEIRRAETGPGEGLTEEEVERIVAGIGKD